VCAAAAAQSAEQSSAVSPNVDVFIDGAEVPDSDFQSYTVDRDMFQPDMAAIVLSNQGDVYSKKRIGQPVEIKVGKDSTSIYQGEITGLEPTFKGGEKTRILIRAMNKMHLLLRKRKSITFTDKSDQQILSQVVGDAGLTLEWKHDKTITYKHVYQHNQTDLEFLRTRAARMGCHVWCVGTKIYVKQPNLRDRLGIELTVDEGGAEAQLRSFTPRLSSASIFKKVTVKGWNPETKELIVGEASAEKSGLGSETASAGSGAHGEEENFTVDHPIWSKEEATALAKARLTELSLQYMTGEAEVTGNPKFELGKTVKIVANGVEKDDPFNGDYYIMGISHRHTMSKSKDGGFVTILRLARDAQKT
jgi:phage protein D